MSTGDKVVDEARSWIGTPYRHQASVKGAGCDCLGLLRGVWRQIHGVEPEAIPAYSMDWDEVARQDVLHEAAARHLAERPIPEMQTGDVLLFRMRRDAVAKHVGLVATLRPTTFVHSYAGHGVVESALTAPWRRRIAAVFAFPSVSGTNT